MPDVFTPAKRSEVMSRIRSTGNAATELRLRALMRAEKITGWPPKASTAAWVSVNLTRTRLLVRSSGMAGSAGASTGQARGVATAGGGLRVLAGPPQPANTASNGAHAA